MFLHSSGVVDLPCKCAATSRVLARLVMTQYTGQVLQEADHVCDVRCVKRLACQGTKLFFVL
jgi:hypothetical protein